MSDVPPGYHQYPQGQPMDPNLGFNPAHNYPQNQYPVQNYPAQGYSPEMQPPGGQYGNPAAMSNQPQSASSFPITTALEITGLEIIRSIGLVYGIVARSPGAGKSIAAGFKSIAGGEIKQYTRLVEDSRRHAMDRMIDNALQMGANAIISMRFDSSEIAQGITEVVAYGTAVVVQPRA